MSEFLIQILSPWLVTAALIITIIIVVISLPEILRFLKKAPLSVKILLFIILAVSASVRYFLVPNYHRIYFDEDRYLGPAVSFAKFGRQVNMFLATQEKIVAAETDLVARITVPTINAWVFKIFGWDEMNLFKVAKFFNVLQTVLIFTGTYLLFRSYFISLFSSAFVGLLPLNVYWSVSIGLDSYFVFFSLLAFVAAVWYGKNSNLKTATFLISVTLILLFVRLESFLFLVVIVSVIFAIRQSENRPIISKKDIPFVLLALPFIGVRTLVSLSVLGQTWCCGDSTPLEAFSTSYIIRNTIPNIISLFKRPEMPFSITLLALIGTLKSRDKKVIPFIAWFLCYFFIYSFYFAGIFFTLEYSGSYGRYALMLIPPLVILAGVTLEPYYIKLTQAKLNKNKLISLGFFVFVLTLIPTFNKYKDSLKLSPYDRYVDAGPRQIHDYLEKVIIPNTEEESVIIHPLTSLVVMHGRSAAYFASVLYNNEVRQFIFDELRKGTPVYMVQTYTCDVYPERCREIAEIFEAETMDVPDITGLGYEFLRVKLKETN